MIDFWSEELSKNSKSQVLLNQTYSNGFGVMNGDTLMSVVKPVSDKIKKEIVIKKDRYGIPLIVEVDSKPKMKKTECVSIEK